jgi:hypothetical protein
MQPPSFIADTGLAFAKALVAADYASAHAMLSASLRREMSADDLKARYQQMVSYADAPPDTIEVGQLFEPPESDGVPDGLGWAFVNIDCVNSPDDCWLESIGVLVVNEGPRQAIHQIVWGRP